MDSFELTTAAEKLKTITNLSFFKTFKDLKIYFDIIEYLKNYVPYYAQKAESLNKRKTDFFKNGSTQNNARKTFSQKTLMKHSSQKKLNAYEQLKTAFSRLSWLTHFDVTRQLYADINASKQNFEMTVYHRKNDSRADHIKSFEKKN